MKSILIVIASGALLCAQPPTPPKVAPGTPAPAAPAPPPAPAVAPDSVVAEINGKKYTAAELDKLLETLPQQYRQAARVQHQSLTNFLVMRYLAGEAEKSDLDKRSPYKEQIEYGRIQLLTNAFLSAYGNSIPISDEDERKYFESHPDKYKQAKVRVIYISFNPAPPKSGSDGKKFLTEDEAKAKIEDLRKQIVAGADFGKLARENSEDKTSAAKDGEFGIIKHSSSYPEPVKNAVFALKKDEVSQPVKQPNGFYLIRVDEWITPTLNEVNAEINQELKQERFNDYVKKIQAQFQVKVENPAYFAPPAQPPQLQQVH